MIGCIPGTNNIIYARNSDIYIATPNGEFTNIGTVNKAYNATNDDWGFTDFSRIKTEQCVIYVCESGNTLKYNLNTNTIEYAYTDLPSGHDIYGVFEYLGNNSYLICSSDNNVKYQMDIDWVNHTIQYTVIDTDKFAYGSQIDYDNLIQGPSILPAGNYFIAKIEELYNYNRYKLISVIKTDYTGTISPEEYTTALNTAVEIKGGNL